MYIHVTCTCYNVLYLSIPKREYRDGIKRKETRQGWMDGWMLPW